MAELPMRALTRMWQMLLKSLEEVALAPNAMMAAEMAIIRLTHIADLPSPEDLVKRLKDAKPPAAAPARGQPGPASGPSAKAAPSLAEYASFSDVLSLIRTRRDMQLLVEVEKYIRLVNYTPGRIEFAPAANMGPEFVTRLSARLQNWTGARWGITLVNESGESTIEERKDAHEAGLQEQAMAHPLVAVVFSSFSGAEIRNIDMDHIKDLEYEGIVPIDSDEMDDDWEPVDPFEEQA